MLLRSLIAELIGTFALVFAGTGAIVINDVSGGAITHVGVALVFGLVVMAMVQAVGDVSGAHMNPAVTVAFCAARRFPSLWVVPYVIAQLAGAVAASRALHWMFSQHATLGGTAPTGITWEQAFVLEAVLTFLLMFVILRVSEGAKESGLMAGVAVGATVGLEAMFAGPVCGASMNPARSLGPAVISGQLEFVSLYVAAPTLGALLAVPTAMVTRPSGGILSPDLED